MLRAVCLREHLKKPLTPRSMRRVPFKPYNKKEGDFAWREYLTGNFMLNDSSMGMQLNRQKKLFEDPALLSFMAQKSATLLLPIEDPLDLSSLNNRST
jgi:hypothetical protein